ncbi:MAG: hypothetical protein ACXVDW_21700, partial [Bacteroidia bacterium]
MDTHKLLKLKQRLSKEFVSMGTVAELYNVSPHKIVDWALKFKDELNEIAPFDRDNLRFNQAQL